MTFAFQQNKTNGLCNFLSNSVDMNSRCVSGAAGKRPVGVMAGGARSGGSLAAAEGVQRPCSEFEAKETPLAVLLYNLG